ncbi:MAG: DNA-binding domain-containing protein [Gammaproteobacteria bacterium]
MTDGAPGLRALQAAFARAIRDGEYVPEAGVFRERGLSARQRLNVYHHHSRIVEGEALAAVYPAVQRLVGEDFFANMAILYGRQYPLTRGDLRLFGGQLADFVAQFEPLQSIPYMADVARLEWHWHESLHAAQAPAAGAEPDPGRVCLAPHVRLLRSPFPVATIWDFALREHAEDAPRLDIDGLGPEHVLIMRPGLDVEVVTLPAAEWEWLAGFREPTRGADTEEESARLRAWLERNVLAEAGK